MSTSQSIVQLLNPSTFQSTNTSINRPITSITIKATKAINPPIKSTNHIDEPITSNQPITSMNQSTLTKSIRQTNQPTNQINQSTSTTSTHQINQIKFINSNPCRRHGKANSLPICSFFTSHRHEVNATAAPGAGWTARVRRPQWVLCVVPVSVGNKRRHAHTTRFNHTCPASASALTSLITTKVSNNTHWQHRHIGDSTDIDHETNMDGDTHTDEDNTRIKHALAMCVKIKTSVHSIQTDDASA